MLQLKWVTCQSNTWCSFERVNLDNAGVKGVYIIWYSGQPGRVVRLGQGDVKARITAHRNDPKITKYAANKLLVTWATVPAAQMDGVERYLADKYPPLVGDAFPDVTPIAVNAPW